MVLEDAGDYMRIGKVSVNKRKIKQIRSQGNNVIVDASGPQQGFFPGNMFAIDYRDVTAPQTFATVEELEAWVIQGSNVNPVPNENAIRFEGTSELIYFENDETEQYITFETI